MNTTRMSRRLAALAGLAAVASSASAFSLDPEITIDRALNSPTIAVRYNGVAATLVELRINGESLGTREVSGDKKRGETNFTIDLAALKEGDNLVEVVLYDRTGKVVERDKTSISVARESKRGPVFVESPKAGATVRGPVQVDVGFGEKLGKSYVSFFVDGKFHSLTNFPPYTFSWDTEKEANGWHDIEAWAIDEANETHKSGAVKFFVNNPGGRTNRPGAASPVALAGNAPRDFSLVGADSGLRALGGATAAVRVSTPAARAMPPAVVDRMVPMTNAVRAAVTAANGLRPATLGAALATGPKSLVPTGKRLAFQVSSAVTTAMVSIVTGVKLPAMGAFPVLLDGQPVRFDVPTRVENGVALSPLRSLVEKAGGKVVWDHKAKVAHAGLGGRQLDLTIGDLKGRIDGKNLILEKAPGLENGRTVVPLSMLHDAFGMDVKLDGKTGNVVISTAKGL